MSELKAYTIYEGDVGNYTEHVVYSKSEVDAYIRHHKYKRCLAMAERCKDRIENALQYNEHDDWLIVNEFWERWHKRWMELAEQFKETK